MIGYIARTLYMLKCQNDSECLQIYNTLTYLNSLKLGIVSSDTRLLSFIYAMEMKVERGGGEGGGGGREGGGEGGGGCNGKNGRMRRGRRGRMQQVGR